MKFSKIEALGNDFAVFGEIGSASLPSPKIIQCICNRHYGIGADCAIFIGRSDCADFSMHVYNPDGFEAEICGNALRCSTAYISDCGYYKKRDFIIETKCGLRSAKIDNRLITAEIGLPKIVRKGKLEVAGKVFPFTEVSIGNPHCVIFCPSITDEELAFYGNAIEKHSVFENGINVEFVTINNDGTLSMRVWERGIGETLSCSTGSCAAVAAAKSIGLTPDNIDVKQPGGTITVECKDNGSMFISGYCNIVFKGYLNLNPGD